MAEYVHPSQDVVDAEVQRALDEIDSIERVGIAAAFAPFEKRERIAKRQRRLVFAAGFVGVLLAATGMIGYANIQEAHKENAGIEAEGRLDMLTTQAGMPMANVNLSTEDVSDYPFISFGRTTLDPSYGVANVDLKIPGCVLYNIEVDYQTASNETSPSKITQFVAINANAEQVVFQNTAELTKKLGVNPCATLASS